MKRTVKTIAFIGSLVFVAIIILYATNVIDHQLTDPVVKTCKLPPGQKETHGISELPLNGGVIYPDGFRYDCTEHGLVVSSDPLDHYIQKPVEPVNLDVKPGKGLGNTKPGKLSVTCEYPGCSGPLQTTGPAITTKPGSIANTGTIGSVTISTYPTGTVSVYSSNSPVCRIHPDEEITGVVGICDEKRAAEDAMKQYVPLENK